MLDQRFPQLLPTGPLPQLPGEAPPADVLDIRPSGGFSQYGSSRTYGHDATVAEIQSWVRQDIDFWSLRDARFQRDQDLFELAPPAQMPRNRNNRITLNDPLALVNKVTRILASHPNIIEVQASPGADPSIAQRMENYLYDVDRAINHRWIKALHNPYRWDQAFSATLRGWIVQRTMFDPAGAMRLRGDPSALWNHQIVEPACVYPYTAGGDIRRITHSYQTTVGDLCRDPILQPFLDPAWHEQDYRSSCHVTALYWQAADGGWYHAVLGGVGPGSGLTGNGGLWIKPPGELGYNPWTIVLCGGAGYRQTPWDDQMFTERVGTGILDATADNQKYMDKMVTRLNELLAMESNPAVSYFSAGGVVKNIDLSPGARNYLMKDEKIELHRAGPEIRDFQLLWDILRERQSRGGISDAFFADRLMDGQQNGMAAATALAAARDVMWPYAEGINSADALTFSKMFELYRDFGPGIPLPSKVTQGNGMMQGIQAFTGVAQQMGGMQNPLGNVSAATVDVWEVMQQGVYVDVTREDMTPMEIAQRINLAMGMVKDQIISRETARKDYVKLRNPQAENIRTMAEMVYQDPRLIQALVPFAMSANGQEPLAMFYQMIQNPMPAQNPGQNPGRPQGSNGPEHGNMPTQVMPPAMMGDPMTNVRTEQVDPVAAQMDQLMAMINGGAQGGAGFGGTPPQGWTPPGTPSPASRGY